MAKFHVTKNGKTEPCGASVRACPLGEANHFDSLADAVTASMAEETQSLVVDAGAVKASQRVMLKSLLNRNKDRKRAAAILTPENITVNAHRIYEFLEENDLDDDSAVRESAFQYAMEATGRDYDEFYDAWLEQKPLNSAPANTALEEEKSRARANAIAWQGFSEERKGREDFSAEALSEGLKGFYDPQGGQGRGAFASHEAADWLEQQASPKLPEGVSTRWFVQVPPAVRGDVHSALESLYDPREEEDLREVREYNYWQTARSFYPELFGHIESKLDAVGNDRQKFLNS
ncbi:hypothetical protein [Microbacterium sp. KR10-403]|uniref:hypothetical protein n=1 Tax=Microbacterium sp. KR10-403 TaxID=3158581 RepID=UPI0032E3E255